MAAVKKRKLTQAPGPSSKKRSIPRPKSPSDDDGEDESRGESSTSPTRMLDPMIDPTDSEGSSMSDEDEAYDIGGSDLEEATDDEEVEHGSLDGEGSAQAEDGDKESKAKGQGMAPSAKGKGKFRPPTLEELDTLNQAQSSGGNTFTLQLEALLSSTLLSKTPSAKLKSMLSTIHSHIMSLPSLPALSPSKASKRLEGKIPFPGPEEFNPLKRKDVNWTLGWEKPEEVLIAGSWSVCGGYKKGKGKMGDVDVAVVMPPSLFSPKDRLDYRYFHKRAHYLAVIRQALVKLFKDADSPLQGVEISWENAHGDARRPILVVSCGKDQGFRHATEVRIAAIPPTNLFPASTLSPSRSLLRHPFIPQDSPTPLYNTSILYDVSHKAHLLHLHHLSQSMAVENTVESFLALWRIWCSRRGIDRYRGGSGWFGALLLGWVVDGGMRGGVGGNRDRMRLEAGLGKSLDAWKAFRAALERLAHTDFAKQPISLCVSQVSSIPIEQMLSSYEEVMVDSTGTLNVFGGWEKGDVQVLQHHARETLSMLEEINVDHFANVFLKDHTLGPATFDEYLSIDISDIKDDSDLKTLSESSSKSDRLVQRISTTLRRGLTDRIKLLHCTLDPLNPSRIALGLVYDSANATRVLDIGPRSDSSAEGKAFREFWGDRAELRRFKDGSIAESVVWNISRPEEAALIPFKIITYLLQRHFNLSESASTSFSSDRAWSELLQIPTSAHDAICVARSEKLGFRPLMDGYEELSKSLKAIDDELPLSILQVQPSSELLRYSTTFVPHPIDTARYASSPDCLKWFPRADVVLQFESSPRWPDDLAAIQKVKLALMQKLAVYLTSAQRGLKASVAFDAGSGEIEDQAGLEVVLPSGVSFLLRIFHERERTLLERIIDDDAPSYGTSLPTPPRRLALPALNLHIRRFVHLPKHHSSIAPLHHRYPSFSTATRLLKRWIASHMLSIQIEPEALELLMAYMYSASGTLHAPSSASSGFVRSIKLLAEWEWKAEPLCIPVAAIPGSTTAQRPTMDGKTRERVMKLFEERRSRDPSAIHSSWVLSTENDPEGLRWTKGISRVVANRVKSLAKATLQAVQVGVQSVNLNVKMLFTPTLDVYDLVLHLHPSLITTSAQAVDPDATEWESKMKFRNLQDTAYGEEVRLEFNPAESLARDIQRLYGDSVLVFYDQHGGTAIGLLWNPEKEASRSFKPFLGYSTKPAPSTSALVTVNKQAIVGEIERLGAGLIKSMKIKST